VHYKPISNHFSTGAMSWFSLFREVRNLSAPALPGMEVAWAWSKNGLTRKILNG
jgi:hypothetical protein